MTEANRDKQSDPATLQSDSGELPGNNTGQAPEVEQRPNRGLEDWEMVEQMSEPESGLTKWGLSVVASFVLGALVFILLAYGVYYFLFHYGDLFFSSSGH